MVICGLEIPNELIIGESISHTTKTYSDSRQRVKVQRINAPEYSYTVIIPRHYAPELFLNALRLECQKDTPATEINGEKLHVISLQKSISAEAATIELNFVLAPFAQRYGKTHCFTVIGTNEAVVDASNEMKKGKSFFDKLDKIKSEVGNQATLALSNAKDGLHYLLTTDTSGLEETTKSYRDTTIKAIMLDLGYHYTGTDCPVAYYNVTAKSKAEAARQLTPWAFKVGNTFLVKGTGSKKVEVLEMVSETQQSDYCKGYTAVINGQKFKSGNGFTQFNLSAKYYTQASQTHNALKSDFTYYCKLLEHTVVIKTDTTRLKVGDRFEFCGDKYQILTITREDNVYTIKAGKYD